ncbi:MAG: c-type cytochrome [Anaerolineae bacterium]|nr:c-type cytochrome [Anaerolineae bacterium]CAG1011755.1 hypothetical protein ANRL4_04489 [Anaerolineae bacterium]
MFRRASLLVVVALTVVLGACGTPATPAPALPETPVRPTRVPVELPTKSEAETVAESPTAVVQQPTNTPAPVRARPSATPTMTLIAASPTPAPPTHTPTQGPTPVPDPERGKALFSDHLNGDEAIPTCLSCHMVEPLPEAEAALKIGPAMIAWGNDQPVAVRARSRVASQDPATYLRNSILHPNEYLVPNVEGRAPYGVGEQSLMYQEYAKLLTEAQINDLVAYLLTFR